MNYTDRNLHIERTACGCHREITEEAPKRFLHCLLPGGLTDEVMYKKVFKSPWKNICIGCQKTEIL